jgi:hypothetical protein
MRIAFAASVLSLAGCAATPFGSEDVHQTTPAGLAYTVQSPSAAPDGRVALSLQNRSAAPIGYNLCVGALEQLRGPLWIPALSTAKACPEAWSTLEPGQRATSEAPLPAGLGPGDYRFVTRLKVPADGLPVTQVRSNPFSIAR